MPIGPPSHSPDPKSACRPSPAPMESMIVDELSATGSSSTAWFHGLLRGNTGQSGARGRRSACDGPARAATRTTATATNHVERTSLSRQVPKGPAALARRSVREDLHDVVVGAAVLPWDRGGRTRAELGEADVLGRLLPRRHVVTLVGSDLGQGGLECFDHLLVAGLGLSRLHVVAVVACVSLSRTPLEE